MTKLVDEELEADEEFWGQDAFKEVRPCPFASRSLRRSASYCLNICFPRAKIVRKNNYDQHAAVANFHNLLLLCRDSHVCVCVILLKMLDLLYYSDQSSSIIYAYRLEKMRNMKLRMRQLMNSTAILMKMQVFYKL